MDSCCCIDVDCTADVYSQDVRRARKPHQCIECGHEIQPGEEYEDFRGHFEHGWETYHTCWFCLKVREDFFPCGWFFGMMREHFYDCNGWDYAAPVSEIEDEGDDDG